VPAVVEKLRKKAFGYAIIAIALIVIIELGAYFALRAGNHSIATSADLARLVAGKNIDTGQINGEQPPGLGIPYLALVDGLLLFTMLVMVLGMTPVKDKVARLQGIATLILMILFILGSVVLGLAALGKLVAMVSLFVSAPFGTITYLVLFGNFDTTGASVALALVMALKLFFCVQLVLGQQRFLQMKGLVALVLTSLLCTFIVGLLHGLVPSVLVSITDAIAAVILAVVAIIWALVLLVGSVVAVVRAV
jgi:hypothetical protein